MAAIKSEAVQMPTLGTRTSRPHGGPNRAHPASYTQPDPERPGWDAAVPPTFQPAMVRFALREGHRPASLPAYGERPMWGLNVLTI